MYLDNTLTQKKHNISQNVDANYNKKKTAIRPYGEWVSMFKLLRTSFWNRTHHVAHSFFHITS